MSQAFETLISYGIKRNKPNMRIRQCTKHFKVIHRAYRCIDIHIPIHIPVQYRKKISHLLLLMVWMKKT